MECPECRYKYPWAKAPTDYIENFTIIKWMKSELKIKPAPAKPTASESESIQIVILPLNGEKFLIKVKPTDTIAEVKKVIARRMGLPIETQRLIYGGKGLMDKSTVAQAKLKNACVVHTVLRLKGGHFL